MKNHQIIFITFLILPFVITGQTNKGFTALTNPKENPNAKPAYISVAQSKDGTIERKVLNIHAPARDPDKEYDTLVVVMDKFYEMVNDVNFDGDQTWYFLRIDDFNSNNIA